MGICSNPANKAAYPVTAWFCKVGHHLGTTKQKNSKPLCGLLITLVYQPFSLPLTGRLCVLPDVVSILLSSRSSLPYSAPARARSRSTCGAFGKAAKRPLPGDWGGPQQADFTGFRQGENRENRKVCTTLHCLPLLRADKREVRIIPNRAHLNQSY